MNGKQLNDSDLNQTVSLANIVQGEETFLSLYLSEVDIRHAANFTCEARNDYQMERRSFQVLPTCEGIRFSTSFLLYKCISPFPVTRESFIYCTDCFSTAVLRKVVGKSVRANAEWLYG